MDATQDARLKHVESMLSGLDFAINNGTPTPYSVRGELTSRLRTIDGHTIAQPVTADTITAAVVAALPKVAVSTSTNAQPVAAGGLTVADVTAAVEAGVRSVLGSLG